MSSPYVPSARHSNWLIAVGLIAIGYAIYLRYMVLENVQVGLTCDAGQQSWLCLSRRTALLLDNNDAFGWAALIVALLAFIRPGVVLLSLALTTTALGLVMHNAGLAGIAGGLIVLSLARPAARPA